MINTNESYICTGYELFYQRTMTSSNLLAIHKSKDIELLHFSTDVSTLEEAYYIRIAK